VNPGRAPRARVTVGLVALGRRDVDTGILALYEEAGRNALRGAVLLVDLLAGFPERAELAPVLKDCEHDGDRLTHDIIHRLRCDEARLPVDANDGHALATALDDIVDFTEQTADWMVLYAIEAPMEPGTQIAEVLVSAVEQLVAALARLREGADMAPHLAEVSRLEDEGDRLFREGVASLFVSGIDPMVVIRWKDIFLSLESAVDACETAAHVLEGMALKRHISRR
jgi:uncharacterized protein Yka (UPF0111/DUF47 family)